MKEGAVIFVMENATVATAIIMLLSAEAAAGRDGVYA